MPNATPRWTGVRFSYGVSATRSWDVLALNEGQAIDEVGIQQGSTHPLDSSLVASSPEANEDGFNKWIVTVNWARAGQGGGGQNNGQKARISWRRAITSEAFDRDPHGNPIVNSALDPFDPPPSDDVAERGFIIRRIESSYDLAKAEEFENTVNDADFTFLGKYPFKKGQVKCDSILPVGDYDFDAASLEIEYAFWFRRDGWKRRIKDQGARGWYIESTTDSAGTTTTKLKKGLIYDAKGLPVNVAALDGGGSPLNTDYRIGVPASPGASLSSPPPGATLETTKDAIFLIYDRLRETSFGGLEL